LTLFGIFYPVIKNRWEERKKAAAQIDGQKAEASHGGIHFGSAALFTLVLIAVLAWALWQSRNFGYRAGLFPWVIGTPTLILAFFQLARDLMGKPKERRAELAESVERVEVAPRLARQRTILIILWTVGFFLAIWLIGFSYAVPLTIFLYLKFAGKENWPMTLAVTFFSWLFYWVLFERLLRVPFPEGLLISLIKGGQ
jgi:hypothetical protein